MTWQTNPKEQAPGLDEYKVNPDGVERASRPQTEVNMENKPDWEAVGREAYLSSTTYMDSNYRAVWEDNIKMFKGEHPQGSKFNNPNAQKMSRLFRPKSRTIVRKNEAALNIALFNNGDVVSIKPVNVTEPQAAMNAELVSEVLQFRLDKSIPWFQLCVGALQDSQVTGIAISHQYWNYEKINGRVKTDMPCIDLVPVEHFRFDPSANWVDPVNTSPFLIHIIPMYVYEVKEMIKAGHWLQQNWDAFNSAMKSNPDNTEQTRTKRTANSQNIKEYDVVYVQRHIHIYKGEDYEFYMLGENSLLSDPEKLEDVVYHGRRPYVVGFSTLEAHNVMPTSIVGMGKDLQEEANTVANQRLDNVKFVLNKRWIVRRDANVDVASLVRNVPGSVTMADSNNLKEDVNEVSFQDVTQSAYLEQTRIDSDYDALVGDFNAGSIATNRQLSETAKGMALLAGVSNVMVEYVLRTFCKTWVEPVLRQLVLLEQEYETDETVLAIAGQRAKVWQKYGVDEVTDNMIEGEMLVKVNVGMGATDPNQRVYTLMTGINGVINVANASKAIPFINVGEVAKEIFGTLGYSDGSRFINQEISPELQQAQATIRDLTMRLKSKTDVAEMNNSAKIYIEAMKQTGANDRNVITHATKVLTNPVAAAAAIQGQKQKPNEVEAKTVAKQGLPQQNYQGLGAPQQ